MESATATIKPWKKVEKNLVTLFHCPQGVVAKISRDGLLVNLWGDMRVFAPRSLLSTEPIEYPEKLFFVGQVL